MPSRDCALERLGFSLGPACPAPGGAARSRTARRGARAAGRVSRRVQGCGTAAGANVADRLSAQPDLGDAHAGRVVDEQGAERDGQGCCDLRNVPELRCASALDRLRALAHCTPLQEGTPHPTPGFERTIPVVRGASDRASLTWRPLRSRSPSRKCSTIPTTAQSRFPCTDATSSGEACPSSRATNVPNPHRRSYRDLENGPATT